MHCRTCICHETRMYRVCVCEHPGSWHSGRSQREDGFCYDGNCECISFRFHHYQKFFTAPKDPAGVVHGFYERV